MSKKEHIERLGVYYRQFHHTCLTWYITIMGFFIAGVIAGPESTPKMTELSSIIQSLSVILALTFLYYIIRYGARILCLNEYLEYDEENIPDNWRQIHRNPKFRFGGEGFFFFVIVIVFMQASLFGVLTFKYG